MSYCAHAAWAAARLCHASGPAGSSRSESENSSTAAAYWSGASGGAVRAQIAAPHPQARVRRQEAERPLERGPRLLVLGVGVAALQLAVEPDVHRDGAESLPRLAVVRLEVEGPAEVVDRAAPVRRRVAPRVPLGGAERHVRAAPEHPVA
jgi:hypothetical protein